MRPSALVGLLLLLSSGAAPAEKARTNIGVLTCTLVKAADTRPGEMTCGFKPTGRGQEEKFTGYIRGTRPEGRGKLVLVWAVLGSASGKVSGGQLAQKYIRASAGAGQPPLWVGTRNKEIALQFETNDSARANIGIVEIELRLAGTAV